jgi:hypothetical protein
MWNTSFCPRGVDNFVENFFKNNLKNVRKIALKCYTFRKWKRGCAWGWGWQTPCVNAGHFSNFENDFLYIPFEKHFEKHFSNFEKEFKKEFEKHFVKHFEKHFEKNILKKTF